MARTPLSRIFSRALHLSRVARRSGAPLDEVVAADRERRLLHRRAILAAGAAGLALPLLPGCNNDGPTVEPDAPAAPPTVAIIGGGIAGLHCAYRLAQAGVHATIYEASKRLGGRMFTDRATFYPMTVEMAGEFMDTPHETMQALADELGIARRDFSTDDESLTPTYHIDGAKMTMEEVATAFGPAADAVEKALASLTDQDDLFVYYDKPNGGEALDALSLAEWFDQENIDGPIRKILTSAYTREFGLEPEELNCLDMIFLLATNLDREAFRPFGASDERFTVDGGNETFIERLATALDPDQIQLGTAMESIAEAADGTYVVGLVKDGSSFEITADHVVLALPFHALRKLKIDLPLPEPQMTAIKEMGYGENTKLFCGFKSRVWRDQGANGEIFTDRALQAGWDASRLQPGTQGIFNNYMGGEAAEAADQGSPYERMSDFLEDIDVVFPGMKDASNGLVQRADWDEAYSCYLVGQYTKFTGSESIPYNGVHFCGEHTSLDYQGWMEGAASTGARAAAEILEAAGLSATVLSSQAKRPPALWTPSERIWIRADGHRRNRRRRRLAI